MITRAEVNCIFCANYLNDKRCKAFPDGIPDDLFSGKNLHRQPYQGDNGILYSPLPRFEMNFDDILDEISNGRRNN